MKKTSPIVGLLITIIIVITSCSKEENISSKLPLELKQAEAIMYEHPDSALQILQGMQVSASSKTLQYATWALFMTQAKYKMYMEQSDSLINIAYDYFMKQDNVQRKALVLYLKGGMCNEKKKIEDAQKNLLKAADYAASAKDYQLCYLINAQLGNLYIYRSYKDYAFNSFNKAYQYAVKSMNPEYIISSLMYLGRIYSTQNKYKQSINYYKTAIDIAEKEQYNDKYIFASNELAGVYFDLKDYKNALLYIKQAIKINSTRKIEDQINLVIGKIYSETENPDSAYFYLNQVISSQKSIYSMSDAYYALYKLSKKEQKYKDASIYSDKLLICIDSIYNSHQNQDVAEMQERYNQQRIINEKNILKLEKDENTRNALTVLVLLLCLTAILIYIYQRKLMNKERTIQKKEEELRRNTIKISDNRLLIQRNLLRIKELMEQIEANKDVKEQLEELNQTYAEIQQQNKELTKENQHLQEYIDEYSSSINAQSEELKRLNSLTEENQHLHDREKTLCNQLVKNTKILNSLLTTPKYLDTIQWNDIEEAVNKIFDNLTSRLLKEIPTLTEYDLHLCCLIKIGMSNASIAAVLGISPASVSKQKFRLKERITQHTNTSLKNGSLDLWLWEF